MVDQYRGKPRDQAAELLECFIAEQGLRPHQKLPSERELCQSWGFSRSTLRSAIHKLVTEGKLYAKVGSGTYVAPPKLVRNLQDMEKMDRVAQKYGKTLATQVLAVEKIECTKQISRKLKLPLGHRILVLTRLRTIDGVPTLIDTGHLDYDRFPGLESFDFTVHSLYEILETHYGLNITHGEESISITYATQREAELLDIPPESALFFLSGVSHGENDMPVEYFKSVVRSDQIRFSSVLTR